VKIKWVGGFFLLCVFAIGEPPKRGGETPKPSGELPKRSREGLVHPVLELPVKGPIKLPSLDQIFSSEPLSPFDGLLSPFTQNTGALSSATQDFEDGCRDLAIVLGSQQHSARWLEAVKRIPPSRRRDCLKRAARVLRFLEVRGTLTSASVIKRREEVQNALSAAENAKFFNASLTAGFREASPADPNKPYDVYVDRDGTYDFLEFDPQYPNLYFGSDGVYQKAKGSIAQVIEIDEKKGRLTAEGLTARKDVHNDLFRWLEEERKGQQSPQALAQSATLAALLLGGMETGDAREQNLKNMVQDLVALHQQDKAGKTEPGQTGLELEKVIEYLKADPARQEDLNRLEWALTHFSRVKEPEDACRQVCSLFSAEKYKLWRLSETALGEGSEGSINFAYLALQARFVLEAQNYCSNRDEVDRVFKELVPVWLKSRTDGKTNETKGDTSFFNPYKAYGKSFSILFDRRFQTLYGKNRKEERKNYEDLLANDLADPRFAAEHPGGSNLGNTTFHLAFNTVAAPRDHEYTQKAVSTLRKLVDTCKEATGSPYQIPYYIDWKNGEIDPGSCLSADASEDGAAARVVPIYLALYLKTDFQSVAQRLAAKKELEGALQKLYQYSFNLKAHVRGSRTHIGAAQKAPYYWYPALAMAGSALAILERDYPKEKERYERIKSAFRSTGWEMRDEKKGVFQVHGALYANSDQFNQPLAGLAFFGLGVCPKKGAPSFGLVDPLLDVPNPATLEEYKGRYQTIDKSKFRLPMPKIFQKNHDRTKME
jgi:hypothetical protein